jgi:2-polyprenyl-3-methyl-5-hydroxy-6-metoxy-1,4-benzoquinol methylase
VIDTCPLCDSTGYKEIFKAFRPPKAEATGKHTEDLFGRAGRIVRCSSCTLVRQLDPPVAPYHEAEEDAEYLSEEAGIRTTFRNIVERIERWQRPGTLLDIGCGPGLLLDEARARGWRTVGVEPSAWASGEATKRGLDVHNGTLEGLEIAVGSIDAIVAADVIEHVPDPLAFAKRINELLAPNGVVFIATPDVGSVIAQTLRRWWWSIIPNHLWFFSRATLRATFEKASAEVLDVTTHPKTFSLAYYAGRFGGYTDALSKITRRTSRVFGPPDKLVTPDFRDRIAMVARKN